LNIFEDNSFFVFEKPQNPFNAFKDRVHCFSMQVVMNKCFFINPGENGADLTYRFRKKHAL